MGDYVSQSLQLGVFHRLTLNSVGGHLDLVKAMEKRIFISYSDHLFAVDKQCRRRSQVVRVADVFVAKENQIWPVRLYALVKVLAIDYWIASDKFVHS